MNYHQQLLDEYCNDFGVKPRPTDILCAKIMDSGLNIHWRPSFDFKIIRKTTGCEGRLALCVSNGWRGYKDSPWIFNGVSGYGVDLMKTVGDLIKQNALQITKRDYDSFIWVD